MKLITRTYLSIGSLVFIQALLAFNFLAISLTGYSQKDGARTLNRARDLIDGHLAQINRLVWQDLTHLGYTELPELSEMSVLDADELLPVMIREVHTENLDYLTVSSGGMTACLDLGNPYGGISVSDLPSYKGRWHPSIVLKEKEGTLYMIGALRMEGEKRTVVLNLIKKLDNRFCKDLSYNTSSEILLFIGDRAVSGTVDPEFYSQGLRTLQESWTGPEDSQIHYDVSFYSKYYNILLHNLSFLEDRETPVHISILSQNLSIKERIAAIQNQFLIISILCAAMGLIISIFISRTVSKPVQELSVAMARLRAGSYPRVRTGRQTPEITRLYEGFNSMAEGLRDDAVKQERYFREITYLNDFNERIFESIQEGIAVIGQGRKITRINSSFARLCPGIDPENGSDPEELFFWDSSLGDNLEKLRSGRVGRYEHLSRLDGNRVYDIRLYPLSRGEGNDSFSCILMVEDVSSREQMEAQLLQAERLKSLSILTAGVAHEINNPLNSIIGNINNIRDSLSDEEDLTALNWVRQEADRIAVIIRNLMSFNGTAPENLSAGDDKLLLEHINHYMFYVLKEHERVEFTLTDNSASIKTVMPAGQLQQILINLLNNAVHAVGQKGAIELEIRDESEEGMDLLAIHVRDDGPGIPPDLRSRIYDPFFTTKPVGKGTGLGLSIVYGMVSRYHGSIMLNQAREEGCEFILRIPKEQ